MTNPATAAILNNKRLESIKEDEPSTAASVLNWKHWSVSLPPENKRIVITNDRIILVATMVESKHWTCGLKVYTFQDYPKWCEHPNFSKTSKKVEEVKKF